MKFSPRWLLLVSITITVSVVAEPVAVEDAAGDTLRLAAPAQRVVALSPHIVENVFAAGAGDLLVGRVEYADYPPKAKHLPRVGSFAFVNLESLLALKPDLVIAWGSGNGGDTIAQIRDLDIPVFVDEPRRLQDIAQSLRAIGALTNRQAAAQTAAEDFLGQLQNLRQRYTDQQTVSVLYQIWHSPIQTVNQHHIISDVIALCGGHNAFGDAVPEAPVINRETVVERDPDVIIASGAGEQRPAWLDAWREWPSLSAVKNANLYFVPPDFLQRHTPRILTGAKMVCEQLEQARKIADG